MREIIQNLNDELMVKDAKKQTLEDKMELLMKNHEEQSECMHKQDELMRKQNEQMQLNIQHNQMNNLISGSSDPITSGHHKGDYIRHDNSKED